MEFYPSYINESNSTIRIDRVEISVPHHDHGICDWVRVSYREKEYELNWNYREFKSTNASLIRAWQEWAADRMYLSHAIYN